MTTATLETKRLHISGLTAQISADDLKRRFSSFGTVKALDGLGKRDALGDPRPYAYVTLEATKPQLAKCVNLLSGTTWKGARLRIGEARPDFRERIQKEHTKAAADEQLTKKKRLPRGVQGVHASDMSLVTSTTLRSGWKTTPLGRLIRPLRMRPLKPLVSASALEKKISKRVKKPLTRTRRRRIDPEEWGSQYLSGMLLESSSNATLPERQLRDVADEQETVDINNKEQEPETPAEKGPLDPPSPIVMQATPAEAEDDLAKEASNTLSLLNSLFGENSSEWGDAVSLSDVDMNGQETLQRGAGVIENVEDDIEYVPQSAPPGASTKATAVPSPSPQQEEEKRAAGEADEDREVLPLKNQHKSLKDMFAPRAEEASFSLLGGLDLDLDTEEGVFGVPQAPLPLPKLPTKATVAPPHTMAAASHVIPNIDTSLPLFFSPFSDHRNKRVQRTSSFHRSETAEEIRQRWMDRKGELTGEWKRRHREAVKSLRRRGGGGLD